MGSPMGKLAKYMNWNLLHTFVVIAEQQSVSRAAEVLGRGQPAISAALKKLEDQLGAKLAARGPTSFTLTDAGKLLYREAREISGSIDRLSTLISDLSGELAGTVRLSIASHMTSPLINDAFTEFHRRFPKATFDTTVMNGPDIMNAMASSMIYFGICPVFRQRGRFLAGRLLAVRSLATRLLATRLLAARLLAARLLAARLLAARLLPEWPGTAASCFRIRSF